MKRYKKYMFIILSVLLAGGCVQEDINEALRREAELNVRTVSYTHLTLPTN